MVDHGALRQLRVVLEQLASLVQAQAYLVGDQVSLADLAVAAQLSLLCFPASAGAPWRVVACRAWPMIRPCSRCSSGVIASPPKRAAPDQSGWRGTDQGRCNQPRPRVSGSGSRSSSSVPCQLRCAAAIKPSAGEP